jgi:ABC-type antimicrobial peptide transport system permease subunit
MLAFALFPSRAAAIALSAFGLLALTLAATGLHGLVSYAVARRSREIGIRMAVGATSWEVLRVVLTRTAIMLGIGGALGLALALISGEVLASVVYGVSPRDPVAFVAVGLAMITVGIASCWSPALRALRIDPVSALRAE